MVSKIGRNKREQIVDLYCSQQLASRLVAQILDIGKTSVQRILKQSGYTLRGPSEATQLAYKEGRAIPPTYSKNDAHKAKLSIAQLKYLSQHLHPCMGKHHTEETRRKISISKLGKHPSLEARQKMSKIGKAKFADPRNCPMYGKHLSEDSKKRMSKAHLGKTFSRETKQRMSNARKLLWQSPEYRAKIVPACLKSRRPTDLEQRLINIIIKYGLPYKYTGDGSFIIGRLNPDFVNVNGEKIAIEVFGGHWHQNKKGPLRTEEGRRAILKEYGWKLIVIWGDELKQIPEAEIVKRIA